ncbi:MAG TPA: hypothetical protein VJR70_07370 [Stellaceae bacterium]|nr:hypothetical protein [Stellaceae bacterium]
MPTIAPPRRRRTARFTVLLIALIAALPVGCAFFPKPPPPNPFAGDWTTAEHQKIALRDDTVVLNPPDAPPTAMSAATCEGAFRFGYAHQTRDALLALAPRQPDVRGRLAALLVRPDYAVAEMTCGEGASTYVLLDEHDLVVIHRDRDIAGIERLTRL